jgi:hypothetical protein
MTTAEYPAFAQKFLSIKGGDHSIIHVDFQPGNDIHDKALTAPVTELATFLYDSAVPESFDSAVQNIAKAMESDKTPGFQGAAYGYASEEEITTLDGKKGKGAAVLAVGWDNVDAHKKFQETSTFKEHIDGLTSGMSSLEVIHVQFLEFVA